MTSMERLLPGHQPYLDHVNDLFEFFEKDEMHIFMENSENIRVKRNDVIENQGDQAYHFYYLVEGSLKLTRITGDDKTKTIIELIGPKELVGAQLMLNEHSTEVFPVQISALTSSLLLKISKKFFHSYLKQKIKFNTYFYQQIHRRILRMQADRSMQMHSLEQRLAYFLENKVAPIQGIELTRKELAQAVGTTEESIIRMLALWQKQGLIQNHLKQITIKDACKIRALWSS